MTVIKIPLSWLNDFVEVSDLDPIELAERLTLAGLEVEHIRWMGLNPSERYHLPIKSMDEDDELGWERDKIRRRDRPHRAPSECRPAAVGDHRVRRRQADDDHHRCANLKPGDSMLKIAFATIGTRLVDPSPMATRRWC